MKNMIGGYFMDYEIMMNGNIKLGQMAPDFEAETTMGNIKLSDYKGKWLVFFSHPRRFYTCMHNWDNCICKSKHIFWKYKYMFTSV